MPEGKLGNHMSCLNINLNSQRAVILHRIILHHVLSHLLLFKPAHAQMLSLSYHFQHSQEPAAQIVYPHVVKLVGGIEMTVNTHVHSNVTKVPVQGVKSLSKKDAGVAKWGESVDAGR